MECYLYFLGLFLGIASIRGSSDVKSSLTFVIDDTFSMHDDIQQVKQSANAIFDTVMNSKASQIEDFVLVTFNDPDVSLRTVTKDRATFKQALASIIVHGGDDCPEMAMGGIEEALKSSREASFLYVFTDASAKDYTKFARIEALSQKMRSQVVFVLTGYCNNKGDEKYLVYHKIAKATQGQVFHLKKHEISKILKYVSNTIESRKNVIVSKTYPPGHGNTFDVVVDGDTKELVIAVSGKRPSVEVTNSEGTKMPTEDITKLDEIAVVKVLNVKPDTYKVEVGSSSDTYVVVSGTTTVHFKHGFSILKPAAITDTVTRPVPGEKSHISIKLATEGGNVELTSVQILDMDDNVVLEKPLQLIDKAEQFYTTEPVVPPNHMFKIAIKGYDTESKTFLTRISLTPIKPQDPSTETVLEKAPQVSIDTTDGGDKINAEYGEPLQLKCLVSGYPKPNIIWESDDSTATLAHTESVVELPYDYVSVLNLDKVNKNATYTCKAANSKSTDSATIAVETKIKRFFNVLEMPKDTTIEYQKQGQLFCKVDALPPASVSWYKGLKLLKPDGNIEFSADNFTLTIHSMEPYIADQYICEVRNNYTRKATPFKVSISGVEAPKINKTIYYIDALKHSNVDITCNVTKGKPKPTFNWFYNDEYSNSFIEINETEDTLHIEDVEDYYQGMYRCVVKNVVGEDYHDIDLVVEYPPSVTSSVLEYNRVNEGDTVTLSCPVDGVPTPDITWRLNGSEIRPKTHKFYRDGSVRFKASLTDDGNYECEARNDHGVVRISTNVYVVVPVAIEPPKRSELSVMVGSNVALPCQADGSPKPEITWVFHSKDPKIESKTLRPSGPSGTLSLPRIQYKEDGFYTCVASNSGGSKNITYTVTVLVPPFIEYSAKQFTAVLDDRLLRIPCRAFGNPKPDITWSKNGFDLASGSPWYDIEGDGSLIIKNIDKDSAGSYVCQAKNKFGTDNEVFDAIVELYPDPGFLNNVITLEEGKSLDIPCSVPHERTDRLRWFRDGRIISKEELAISNVSQADSGVYSCRVSTFAGAQTGTVKVEVGSRPQFINDDNRNIEFQMGNIAFMDCDATGDPLPDIIWLRDGNKMGITEFTHDFEMTSNRDKGRYTCIVFNKYGKIQRKFVISSYECVLDIKQDFNGNEPLMLTPYLEFVQFETTGGLMRIPKDENIVLACPMGFNTLPGEDILVICENEKQFNYEGRQLSYSDFKCRSKVTPVVKRTGHRCTIGNSEMMNIGFDIREKFVEIYQVCLDLTTNNTLYTKQNIQPSLANVMPKYDIEWFNDGSPVDMERLYDCNDQNNEVSSILNMDFHRSDGCCFARRQLVNARDVAPGLPQTATYTHLNVAPYWGTCNSKNWEDLEQRIRTLTISANHELQVWSGTFQELQLPDADSNLHNITLSERGKKHQVPRYIWKVVQDPASKASLAIVQVNVPDLTLKEAHRYMLCRDVCPEVEWIRNRRWRIVNRGFTYCCSLQDFKRAFRIPGVFPRYYKLLKDVTFISESSALHVI